MRPIPLRHSGPPLKRPSARRRPLACVQPPTPPAHRRGDLPSRGSRRWRTSRRSGPQAQRTSTSSPRRFPVLPDRPRDRPRVLAELLVARPSPEPVAVVCRVNCQIRVQREGRRQIRAVKSVRRFPQPELVKVGPDLSRTRRSTAHRAPRGTPTARVTDPRSPTQDGCRRPRPRPAGGTRRRKKACSFGHHQPRKKFSTSGSPSASSLSRRLTPAWSASPRSGNRLVGARSARIVPPVRTARN